MLDNDFTFHFETKLPVSIQEAFAWHQKPGAFERLIPPFMDMRVLTPNAVLKQGEHFHFLIQIFGGFPLESVHEITEFQFNDHFVDEQIKGPFGYWKHLHKFRAVGSDQTMLEDVIQYRLPLDHVFGQLLNSKVAKKLTQVFKYRAQVLKSDLQFIQKYPQKKMHVVMSGASGMIGSALTPLLKTMGHHVTPLQRHLKSDQEGVFWDIENQKLDPESLEHTDAVIHLAGENIAGLWSEEKKDKIYKSRILSTKLLVDTINKCQNPPKVFISASGVNFYKMGPPCDEQGQEGSGFLHQVIKEWEEEALKLKDTRVVHMRTGVVLSPKGGMLRKMLAAYRMGLGCTFGKGQNYLSWISIQDIIYLYVHALMTSDIVGPINATSPYPLSQKRFATVLAKILKRPRFLAVPGAIVETLGGAMAQETLLADLKVYPEKVKSSDFEFSQPKLEKALRGMLGFL